MLMTTFRLKLKLLKDGIKEHRCEKCNNTQWNNSIIPLELHHINGDSNDNELSNLQLLCCNCHAQTDNYKSKNRSTSKHGRNITDEKLIDMINSSNSISEILRKLGNNRSVFLRNRCKKLIEDRKAFLIKRKKKEETNRREKTIKIQQACCDCGCILQKSSKKVKRCRNCHFKYIENPNRPSLEILISNIEKIGYVETGKKYGVSDNGIRKWLKYFNIDPNKVGYKKGYHPAR
jgi:hypothetical protein